MNPQRELGNIISINISSTNNLAGLLKDITSPKIFQKQEFPDGQICPICYYTITTANYSPLSTTCSHIFCMPCFKEYLTTKISSLQVLNIPCPYSDCQTILSEKIIQKALDKEAYQNYQVLMLKKIMNRNPDIKFCPKPGCSKQFKPSTKTQYTKCSCGVKICNVCCQVWHEGKTCLEAIDPAFELFAKDQDIKFCMMCKSNVQLVQGCKHITCPVCDYEWCWDCGREFNSDHQAECPKLWSPIPPQIREKGSRTRTGAGVLGEFKNSWRETSKMEIIVIVGGLLIFPITIVLILFCWPMCLNFHELDRKKPIASLLDIISYLVIGIVSASFFLIFWTFLAIVNLPRALVWALTWILSCLCCGLQGGKSAQDNGRQVVVQPRTKRWISGNTESFGYTANWKPNLEVVVH